MKVLDNIPHEVEARGFGGPVKLRLLYTLILLEPEEGHKADSAQLIINDEQGHFSNLVCAMSLGGEPTSSVLMDDLSEDVYAQVKLANLNDQDSSQIHDDSNNADYACGLAKRLCKKTGLKQLLVSFSADKAIVNRFIQSDPMVGPLIEKKARELILENM